MEHVQIGPIYNVWTKYVLNKDEGINCCKESYNEKKQTKKKLAIGINHSNIFVYLFFKLATIN